MGANLLNVEYFLVSRGPEELFGQPEAKLHSDGISAIVFSLDVGTVSVSWVTAESIEGLVVAPGKQAIGADDQPVVQTPARWRSLLGRPIRAVYACWQEAIDDESLWAFRLEFDTGSVVVALGEHSRSEVSYTPDEFVVIFDEACARRYGAWAAESLS